MKCYRKVYHPALVILPVVIKYPRERNIGRVYFVLQFKGIVQDGWEVMVNRSSGSLSCGLYSQEDEREEFGAQLTLPFLFSLGFSP